MSFKSQTLTSKTCLAKSDYQVTDINSQIQPIAKG